MGVGQRHYGSDYFNVQRFAGDKIGCALHGCEGGIFDRSTFRANLRLLVSTSILEEGIDVNSQDWDNLTAIIAASSSGHLDIVKLLHQRGADASARDKDNITALMESAIGGHKNVAEFLVKHGAGVDAVAASGVSALWLAAGEGRADLVKFFLNKGADNQNKRMDGITALMAACVGGHLDAAKQLVNSGSDVHAVDQDGLSAIMNAAENGSVPVVSYLIDHGASPINMSTTGFTPLIVAAAGGHLGVVELLIAKGRAQLDALLGTMREGSERAKDLHEALAGGLRTLRHCDQGSLLTVDILLTDPSEIEGGTLQTLECDGRLQAHEWATLLKPRTQRWARTARRITLPM